MKKSTPDWERLLSDAIADSNTRPNTRDFELSQLYGGVVRGDAQLEEIWSRLTAPEQAQLDLHLTGPHIERHATDAADIGRLSKLLADAVKITAKSKSGKKSHSTNLQLQGVQPGSVRLIFRVPAPKQDDPTVAHTEASSIDSNALREITKILSYASTAATGDDIRLRKYLAELPVETRTKLKALAKTVTTAEWTINGTLTQRHHTPEKLAFTPSGAQRLQTAVDDTSLEEIPHSAIGIIDGFRRTSHSAVIIPNGKQAITLDIHDPDLMDQVISLAVEKELPVRIRYTELKQITPNTLDAMKRSYRLEAIEEQPEQGEQTTLIDI